MNSKPRNRSRGTGAALALAAALCSGHAGAQTFSDVSSAAGFFGLNASWGMAWIDYDKDGWSDVLTYSHLQATTGSVGMQLWRNNRNGTFSDVTVGAGLINLTGDTHGVAIGDVDGDGFPDIYLINGSIKKLVVDYDKFWRNNGNGTFTEIATTAGLIGIDARGRGAYAFDANRDGKLDLFVTRFDRPDITPGDKDLGNQLFINNGNLTFTDGAVAAGIDRSLAENRAGSWADFDNDGRIDLLVTGPCVLWHANADGTFSDVTAAAGIEASDECTAAAWGDYNKDGYLDLYISRGFDEDSTDKLYRNNGNGTFSDVTAGAGIGATFLKRGVTWGDYDNDGDLDIYVVSLANAAWPNLLYRNRGDGTFEEVAIAEGAAAQVAGNGAAGSFVDYDNDGDLDLFIANGEGNGAGPYTLLRNAGNGNKWLQLNLVGKGSSNPDALAAKVKVTAATTGTQHVWHLGPQHFLSQSLLPMHIGLGPDTGASSLEVTWPNGVLERVENVAANQRVTLVQGKAIWQDAGLVTTPGIYISQTGTRWKLVLRGAAPGVAYTGTIVTAAPISALSKQGLEAGDTVTLTSTRQIDFSITDDGRGVDSFDFVTVSNGMSFDLKQNGVASPGNVYLGKYLVKPQTLPMTLKR